MNFHLSFTYKGNNTWIIEIIAASLRSSTAPELRKIMDIAYKLDKSVYKGEYEAMITNLDFALNDGTSIQEDELPVILTVTNDYTSLGNVRNTSFNAYFINKILKIESAWAETITIYSATGLQLFSATKDAGTSEIPFSPIPGSLFIVKMFSGLKKILTTFAEN